MGTELQKEPPKELSFWVLFWIALGVIALWAGTGFLLYDAGKDTAPWGERGTFGDMFGSINALFSGLAFAGLIFTVLLQRQELQLQRHELKLQREEIIESRKELAGQRMQLEAQSLTFARQSFESTFFSLMKHMRGLKDQFRTDLNEAAFAAWESARWHHESNGRSDNLIDCAEYVEFGVEESACAIFSAFLDCLRCALIHITTSEVIDKGFYTALLRSQMTDVVKLVTFYSVVNSPANTDIKAMIERHGLFKGLDPKYLFSTEHMFAYNGTAYI